MLNHVTLMGRLTRDPELRRTQAGVAVTSFTLAVERDFGGRDGAEKTTDYIDCVAWRNTGEFVSKYFIKGQLVAVTGRLQIRDWTDRDGNKRRSAEVVIDNAYFAESKRNREGGDYGNQTYRQNAPAFNDLPIGGNDFSELDDGDGELPF